MKTNDFTKENKDLDIYQGAFIRHFKGDYYEVLSIGLHSENLEELVTYRQVDSHGDPIEKKDENTVWVRPLHMFFDMVNRDGRKKARFANVIL